MAAKVSPVFVLTISGSDASGAAGMQADNRAIHAMGAFPLNVVTAITLQTAEGVHSIDITPSELVRMHLIALLNAYPVEVVKAGMLGNSAIVEVLCEALDQYPGLRLVLDPVIQASSGRPLLDVSGLDSLKTKLIPRCTLLTPNLPELAKLTGRDRIENDEQEGIAARSLLDKACRAILVKGGHREGGSCFDRLYTDDGVEEFSADRIATRNARGTGCVLASLIAGGLSNGLNLNQSISKGKRLLTAGLQAGVATKWPGPGPAFS